MAEALLRSLQVKDKNAEDFVDPWTVSGTSETGIDYDKLIRKLIPILSLAFFNVSLQFL